jgi:hypothetical protein
MPSARARRDPRGVIQGLEAIDVETDPRVACELVAESGQRLRRAREFRTSRVRGRDLASELAEQAGDTAPLLERLIGRLPGSL